MVNIGNLPRIDGNLGSQVSLDLCGELDFKVFQSADMHAGVYILTSQENQEN